MNSLNTYMENILIKFINNEISIKDLNSTYTEFKKKY